MNSYYSSKIEGQHTLPLEIEQALEARWSTWTTQDCWSPRMVRDIHQDLFARLPPGDRVLSDGASVPEPGELRSREVSVGRHAAPAARCLPDFLARWSGFQGHAGPG